MGKSNSSTRRKRLARRQGAPAVAGTQSGGLVPHTRRCPCKQCEDERKRQITLGITATDKRRRQYWEGNTCPEHRDEWRISVHRLIAFFKTHEAIRDRKAHLTRVDMTDEWINYLDGIGGGRDLDCGRLWDAFLFMELWEAQRGSPRGRIMRACVIDERSQTEVAHQEHMSQPAVVKNLDAAAEQLLDIYATFLLREQQEATSERLPAGVSI